MNQSHADEYACSAAKVIGRLTNEALKRHAIWADDDMAVRLVEMIPDEMQRRRLLTKVSRAVENTVSSSLRDELLN